MPDPRTSDLPSDLPPGYRPEVVLAERPGVRVVRARFRGAPVVCRLETGEADEGLAELTVLAAARHRGLARLLDHGPLAGGGRYVTRAWVEGEDLAAWAPGRSAAELGPVVVELALALEHLHALGFAHADLKPGNVIVGTDGRPVLSDFGLADALGGARAPSSAGSPAKPEAKEARGAQRTRRRAAGAAGTLFYLAPEVILGAAADARSDLFALGVLLHELLVGERPPASEFYARFPDRPFLEAVGTRPEALPDWARDLVVALVARDPADRPRSALEVARRLTSALGLEPPAISARPRLHWPVKLGREDWIETWLRSWLDGRTSELSWLMLPAGEEPGPFHEALRLAAALAGRRLRAVDLGRLAQEATSPERLDRRIVALVAEAADLPILAVLPSRDPWALRAGAMLARASLQRSEHGGRAPLTVLAGAGEPTAPELEWHARHVPPVEVEAIEAWLEAELEEPDAERRRAFAAALSASARGSATRVAAALERATERGFVVAGAERPRLRGGALPTAAELARDESRASAPDGEGRAAEDARRLQLAAHVTGEGELDELGALTGLEAEPLAKALALLTEGGHARLARAGGRAQLELLARPATVDDAARAGLHERLAERLEDRGAPAWEALVQRLAAAAATPAAGAREEAARPEASAALRRELEGLRDVGAPEIALRALDRAERLLGEPGLPPELRGERALAWTLLGQAELALEAIAPLTSSEDDASRALVERIHAGVALLRHEHSAAIEHAERAIALDPARRGEAEVPRVHALHHSGRDAEVIEAVGRLEGEAPAGLLPRQLDYLRSLRALSRFRTGDVAAARDELEGLVIAGAREDPARRAALELDLATLERRAGSPEIALRHLRRAVRTSEEAGVLHGLAQARAALGGFLRERGELLAAEPHLFAALAVRERSGDVAGANAVRGMLGLLLAERGHVRPAIGELERATDQLAGAQRRLWAPLLTSRAEEQRARIGLPPREADAGQGAEAAAAELADPRVALGLARTRWLRDDRLGARELCERAGALAERLKLVPVAEEARLLARWIDADEDAPADEAAAGSRSRTLAADDERVRRLLLAPAGLDEVAALELARELAENGRDDRAARLFLAVATRSVDRSRVEEARRRAAAAFGRCAAGLTDLEAARLRAHLLGTPDPCPSDLESLTEASENEDLEMEVIKLLEINHRLVEQEDLPSLLGMIVESAISVTAAERGFLILEEGGELRFDTALDSGRGGIAEPDLEVSRSVVRRALDGMRPLRVSNAVEDPLLGFAPSVVQLDLRSILCAPFDIGDGSRGAIYLDHRLQEGAFGERADRLLGLLADQAALAIRQVKRMGEIRRLNEELQGRVVDQEADLDTARRELRAVGLPLPAGGLVGTSPPMSEARSLIERAAKTSLPVLVTGESGTGKELAARALHALSERSSGPFVSENCAAMPATIIEAELFGYRRGAFTGADTDRPGVFQRAHGGTLFLDEIGEMPLELQAKLLRVLETGEVRPLGESRPRQVDFRLVTATNRVLEDEVRDERFRRDLFYRLQGLVVRMPSLARCEEDIPALVEHFLRIEETRSGQPRRMTKEVLARLTARPWPGNVRELRGEVARLCALSDGAIEDPDLVRDPAERRTPPAAGPLRTLAELEREAILQALQKTGGDKRQAADLLGISRAKIYQRLKEWREGGITSA